MALPIKILERDIPEKGPLYPHIPEEHWPATGCMDALPEKWHLSGRRLILKNGCKITVVSDGKRGWETYTITVDEGTLPDDLPYLVRVCLRWQTCWDGDMAPSLEYDRYHDLYYLKVWTP